MDTEPVRCLTNSISRLIHLVSSHTLKLLPTQKDYGNMTISLKLLKQVLDEVVDCKIPSDEILIKECEELDLDVNKAREFMENWSPKMSKICSVLRSEILLISIQSSSIKICHIINKLTLSCPSTSSATAFQNCMQELQCLKLERIERISDLIEDALKSQFPSAENLKKIIYSLSLTTNQELLRERIAVEKERIKSQTNKTKGDINDINQVVGLMSNICDYMVKYGCLNSINGVSIPSYFRCPLSLELMSDPVIVASGQTYERASIQKWLHNGLDICPKTLQRLSHTNLIPNYTVKALIANWHDENKIHLSETSDCLNPISDSSPSNHISPQDLIWVNSFGGSLQSSGCESRSSREVRNGLGQQNVSSGSPEQSYIHSRSGSTSSVEYMPPLLNEDSAIYDNLKNTSKLSEDITSEHTLPSNKEHGISPMMGKQFHSAKTRTEINNKGSDNYPRTLSLPVPNSGTTDNPTTPSQIEKLIEDLKSQSEEVQTKSAAELRLLTKHNTENRIMIGHYGAIPLLVSLLYSEVKITQEHVVTVLLNLSINETNKFMIAEAGPIEPLIHVLKTGNSGAKENSAATLFSLSVLEDYKAKIGRSGAVKALVELLGSGTLRGKKDAATALFNLSIFHENKVRIVKAGAVKHLVVLMDPDTSPMVDKALAILSNLSTINEGRVAIVREGGVPLLVEIVEIGSSLGKENAASVLLQLCIDSSKFCTLVLQEGAVPPLVALSQSGTPRAKEKAQQLLSHFRSQREGVAKKKK